MLAQTVAELLDKRWSPEQVAHELRRLFAGQRHRWLCAETIYQAIYDPLVALTRPARRRRRRRLKPTKGHRHMIVIGADSHKRNHMLVAVDGLTGAVRGQLQIAASDRVVGGAAVRCGA